VCQDSKEVMQHMLLLIHIKVAIKLLIKEGNCREVQILVGWSLVLDQGLLMRLAIKLQVKGWANNNTTWVLEGFHSMAPCRMEEGNKGLLTLFLMHPRR
jgi:hypothetical protein